MGSDGQPTPVDFARQFVIGIVLPLTNDYTEVVPGRLTREGDTLTLHYTLRMGERKDEYVLCAANFTPVPREGYRVGVPCGGFWREVLNSDATVYGGSGMGNKGGMEAETIPCHNLPCSLPLTLPPLAIVVFHFTGAPSSEGPQGKA